MFNIWVDYPKAHEEEQIIANTTAGASQEPDPVLSQEEVIQLQEVVHKVPVSPHVVKYAIRLVRATRPDDESAPDFVKKYITCGAGPRAGQYLILGAKSRAVMDGRIHVSCQDVRSSAIPVLRHRLLTNFTADSEGLNPADLVKRLLEAVEEPSENDYS
jgi:MoxR-like ATPase